MTEKKIENIVFDINGVLVNRPFLRNFLKMKMFPWDLRSCFRLFASKEWDDYNRGKYRNDEEVLAAMNLKNPDAVRRLLKRFYSFDLVEDRKLAEYIKEIRNKCRVYILTNQAVEEWQIIKQCDIVKNTDGIVVSCESGYMKPEKELYEILIKRYDLDPAKTVIVDDRARNVRVGEEVGFTDIVHRSAEETIRKLESLM